MPEDLIGFSIKLPNGVRLIWPYNSRKKGFSYITKDVYSITGHQNREFMQVDFRRLTGGTTLNTFRKNGLRLV